MAAPKNLEASINKTVIILLTIYLQFILPLSTHEK